MTKEDTVNLFLEFISKFWIYIFIVALISYFLGSICFSIIFTKLFKNTDIRNLGSKNAGFTNVLRSVGVLPAVLTMCGDFFKCIIAISVSKFIFSHFTSDFYTLQYITFLSGFCCILGHIYPCWYSFKGGKAVVTSLALAFIVDWRTAVIALAVFLLVFSFSKIISLSSISAAISYPIINFLTLKVYNSFSSTQTYTRTYIATSTTLCIIFSLVIIVKHRENICRLLNGTENQLSTKSKNS